MVLAFVIYLTPHRLLSARFHPVSVLHILFLFEVRQPRAWQPDTRTCWKPRGCLGSYQEAHDNNSSCTSDETKWCYFELAGSSHVGVFLDYIVVVVVLGVAVAVVV